MKNKKISLLYKTFFANKINSANWLPLLPVHESLWQFPGILALLAASEVHWQSPVDAGSSVLYSLAQTALSGVHSPRFQCEKLVHRVLLAYPPISSSVKRMIWRFLHFIYCLIIIISKYVTRALTTKAK